jgi:hypothetical protein
VTVPFSLSDIAEGFVGNPKVLPLLLLPLVAFGVMLWSNVTELKRLRRERRSSLPAVAKSTAPSIDSTQPQIFRAEFPLDENQLHSGSVSSQAPETWTAPEPVSHTASLPL